jgi:hypothetical protein
MALAWKSAELSLPVTAVPDATRSQLVLQAGGKEVQRIDCENKIEDRGGVVQREFTMPLHQIRLNRAPISSASYVDAYKRRSQFSGEYNGKIVLIGAHIGKSIVKQGEQIPGDSEAEEYGYLVHATVVSQILENICPRPLSPLRQLGILFLCCLIAGLARRHLTQTEVKIPVPYLDKLAVPVALIILLAVYAMVVVQMYRWKQIVFTPGYDFLAMTTGYYIGSRPLLETAKRTAHAGSKKRSDRKKAQNGQVGAL